VIDSLGFLEVLVFSDEISGKIDGVAWRGYGVAEAKGGAGFGDRRATGTTPCFAKKRL